MSTEKTFSMKLVLISLFMLISATMMAQVSVTGRVIDMQGGKSYNVTIYDLSGREVHSSSLQAQGTIVYNVNAARMASGQYTVVFTSGSERVARKLVVK